MYCILKNKQAVFVNGHLIPIQNKKFKTLKLIHWTEFSLLMDIQTQEMKTINFVLVKNRIVDLQVKNEIRLTSHLRKN